VEGVRERRRPSPTAAVGLDRRKDPALPDTLYVTNLAAPGTVNTMPEKTLRAVHEHGRSPASRSPAPTHRRSRCSTTRGAGIDYSDVVRLREKERLSTFEDAWTALIGGVTDQLARAGAPADS
jgi:transaldolase